MDMAGEQPAERPVAAGVAEFQGEYGAYSFSEKLLQKIWLRGAFDRAALTTSDGVRVRVHHPGRWNLLGGPDFKDARLRLGDGPELTGDIELHLHAKDWAVHGHASDPAYDRVILHVVLFPPDPGQCTRARDGRELPGVALLPLLHHDLEQFAAEEAVEALANRPASRLLAEFAPLSPEECAARLRRHARARWEQKVRFARLRVDRLGWTAACHHAALEILGYRFNRAPMLRLAAAWPLEQWERGGVEVSMLAEGETWNRQGVRPANLPARRLGQYAAWVRAVPDWTGRLVRIGCGLPVGSLGPAAGAARRTHGLADWRRRLAGEVCGGVLGGPRLDTLVCDGFLPLIAAESGRDLGGLWQHWYPGDLPPSLMLALRELGLAGGRAQPAAHGPGQGLLGWLLDQELSVGRSGAG